jgi:hypothetical protein
LDHAFFTSRDATRDALRWSVKTGKSARVGYGAYVEANATELDRYLAVAAAASGVNTGRVAAAVRQVDCPAPTGPAFIVPPKSSGRRTGAKRLWLPEDRIFIVDDIRVVDGLQMLVDLASDTTDVEWEWALESSLFRRLTTIADLEAALPGLSKARTKGVGRMRRVLALRPPDAPPTESLLETLTVQLARSIGAPSPTRQVRGYNDDGGFEGRVDLCWPELGVFCELDGQHHKGQPVYDANRQTRIAAATGWLCGRFTWVEVRYNPIPTGKRLLQLLSRAELRVR